MGADARSWAGAVGTELAPVRPTGQDGLRLTLLGQAQCLYASRYQVSKPGICIVDLRTVSAVLHTGSG
jgi:hypothetical protein